jgi:hypothetical protein
MRTLQSAGLGFLLVPINTVAFLTLPRELNNDGAALFAMFRNVFGSIGISLAPLQLPSAPRFTRPTCRAGQPRSINPLKR